MHHTHRDETALLEAVASRSWERLSQLLEQQRQFAIENRDRLTPGQIAELRRSIETALWAAQAQRAHLRNELRYVEMSLAVLSAYQPEQEGTVYTYLG